MDDKIKELLVEIFETDNFDSSTKLDELLWDSIGMISFIASVDDVFEKIIDADSLEDCKTVQGLIDLI